MYGGRRMITVEIDGKKLEVQEGTSIIEAAENAGIWIPRFCYHKKLSVAANCRMCLVEVEKAPKPMAACATPVNEGMRIFTTSEKALAAQKIVMEFLLINHPLDCPICDQGGECELQDIAMGYGRGISKYSQGKRSVEDEDLGPLIATDMTRCIHCTRCVRFGSEVAGVREMGMTGRGEHGRIGTYIKHTMSHEMSGNIIDLCPVGALTSKPNRFEGRSWEFDQMASVASHDCVGSNTFIHSLRHEAMRVVPRDNENINEVWLSDRDRFSYEGVKSHHRLHEPRIKKNGEWQVVSWHEAMAFAAEGLRTASEKWGADQVGALASPNSTLEEFYLLSRLMRGVGSNHIDHRLRESDFSDQTLRGAFPGIAGSLNDINQQNAILVLGSDLRREVPIVAHRVRQANKNGAPVMAVNMIDHDLNVDLAENIVASPDDFVQQLSGIADALNGKGEPTSEQKAIADTLKAAEKANIIIGHVALHHPNAVAIRALANAIADLSGATVSHLTDGANSAGAWVAGAIPHRAAGGAAIETAGLNYLEMIDNPLHAYIVMGISPDFDTAHPVKARAALNKADFVVSISSFTSDILSESDAIYETADVILPMVPSAETSGTFVNATGNWQQFQGALKPQGEARPGWKILRVLANFLKLKDFEYTSSDEVLDAVKAAVEANDLMSRVEKSLVLTSLPATTSGIAKVTQVPLYRADQLVRHAPALQHQLDESHRSARLNTRTAKLLKLASGDRAVIQDADESYVLPVMIDDKVSDNAVALSAAMVGTKTMSDFFGPITVTKG